MAWRWPLAWRCRLARQWPTSRLVQAGVGRLWVARPRRLALWLAWLARTRFCRLRRGLAGLAADLGLERLRLGVGPPIMGLGQPVGWCFDRRGGRPSLDRI